MLFVLYNGCRIDTGYLQNAEDDRQCGNGCYAQQDATPK